MTSPFLHHRCLCLALHLQVKELRYVVLLAIVNILVIEKWARYFATVTKSSQYSKIDVISFFAVKNRPDILQLVQKIDPIFLKLYKNRLDILLLKNRVGFLVENRPIKSMHNFETNGAPYFRHGIYTFTFITMCCELYYFTLWYVEQHFPVTCPFS